MSQPCTRRAFLAEAGRLTGSTLLGAGSLSHLAEASRPGSLPRRRLGRTGVEVSIVGMGLAPLGMAGYPPHDFRTAVRAALDEGVNLFDLQPDYGEAEKYLSPVLKKHGARLFVVTKTGGQSKRAVMDSITGSLSRLNAPRVDAVLLNNIGDYDLRTLFHADGALAGLKEARRRGQVRFIGLSGHWRPEHFVQALESGEFDIVMAPFNFVDRHTYSFERDILPVAAKHDIGVVAMKTLGGAVGLKYDTRQQTAMMPERHHPLAIRYALGLPQLCCAVVGCKNAEEVRLAARVARNYRALSEIEQASVLTLGKKLSAAWGAHFPEG
jgi:predicted aldo/keto reductase-like oxidoreductase